MDIKECRPGRIRARVWTVLASALGLLLSGALPVRAQFTALHSGSRLATAQEANLFASWAGQEPLQGIVLELPAGWTLREAHVLRHGYEPVAVEVQRAGSNQFFVTAARTLQGPCEMVFRVQTSDLSGRVEWAVVPFVRSGGSGTRVATREAYRASRTVLLDVPGLSSDNRVLSFAENGRSGGDPLLLRRTALPDLSTRAPYTIRFWMKANGLDEVVLSTWDGDEQQAYPLEFVLDRSGRLLVYRGRPGHHQSMRSRQPVADSRWHHVALTNDPESGWMHLYLDGSPVDSLYGAASLHIDWQTPLAVGGRVPGRLGAEGQPFYTGQIDELGIAPVVQTAAAIRAAMRKPASAENGNGRRAVGIGFEEPVDAGLVERRSARTRRVVSDLSFYRPVQDLRAEMIEGHAVRLTWEAQDEQAVAFVVERSVGDRGFEPIGRLTAADAGPGNVYRFLDRDVPSLVAFYRVRQVFANGGERVSATIKLGLGPAELPATATLLGNFPNPFQSTTTITYEVQTAQQVRISVWDLSGHQVRVLVDQVQTAGKYEIVFQAGDLPSGTYFVRLETPSAVQSHQIILAK